MASSPTTSVLATITRRRETIQRLVGEVAQGRRTLGGFLELSRNPDSGEDATAARFVYMVKVVEVLPHVGKVRARRVLADMGFTERTRVGDIPEHQHPVLIEAFA